MKENELRIGNYYDNNNGGFSQVTANVISEVWEAERTWCKPIPLTEEWLLKFGFEKNDNGFFNLINDSEVEILIRDDFWTCDGIVFSLFNLKSVHQLQNLFFALTGEELKINL